MLTRIVLLLAVLFVSINPAQAQCTPDTTSFEFFSPPPEDLPCIVRNQYYETTIQLFCPPGLPNLVIDSAVVSGITKFPSGISYACYPPDCTVRALQHACILISGTTTDTIGNYAIQTTGTAFTSSGNFSYAQLQSAGLAPSYVLRVIDNAVDCLPPNSINAQNPATATVPYKYFQPSHQLNFENNFNPSNGSVQIRLTDLTGRLCFEQNSAIHSGASVQLPHQLPEGLYCVTVGVGGYSYSRLISY